MLNYWLHKNNSESVILFFCGWGNDYRPFVPLQSDEFDVVCFYAYHQTSTFDWEQLMRDYKHITVIAWSMGVLQAELQCRKFADRIQTAIAINGSLMPVDDQFGIPHSAYQLTIDSFSEIAGRKFVQRMCKDRKVLARFNEHLPHRETNEQLAELVFHQQQSNEFGERTSSLFTIAIVGRADLIFPPDNLKQFWRGYATVIEKNTPHFMFYDYESWDALIKDVTL